MPNLRPAQSNRLNAVRFICEQYTERLNSITLLRSGVRLGACWAVVVSFLLSLRVAQNIVGHILRVRTWRVSSCFCCSDSSFLSCSPLSRALCGICSLRMATSLLHADFAHEVAQRSALLAGQPTQDDLLPLFDAAGRLQLPNALGELAAAADAQLPVGLMGGEQDVRLIDDMALFKLLYRCFAGAFAGVELPRGAFVTGSALLASVTLPAAAPFQPLKDYALQMHEDDLARHVLLAQLCPSRLVRTKVRLFLGPRRTAEELRNAVHHTELLEDGTHARAQQRLDFPDPLLWDQPEQLWLFLIPTTSLDCTWTGLGLHLDWGWTGPGTTLKLCAEPKVGSV
jgi:hypothetical protein